MDNNPTQPVAPQPQVIQPQPMVTAPTAQPIMPQEEHKNGMKMIFMLFIIIILVVTTLAGGYWYMNTQNKQITESITNKQSQSQQAINQVNTELNSLEELDAADKEFIDVDEDTESL